MRLPSSAPSTPGGASSAAGGGRYSLSPTASTSTNTITRRGNSSSMSSSRRLSGGKKNFKVVIRIRPPLARELSGARKFHNVVAVDGDETVLTVSENLSAALADGNPQESGGPWGFSTYVYKFDHVYNPSASQSRVYETTAQEVVASSLQGYNATIFAYGQTGTGKTYTMEGFESEERGIIPRAIEQIFGHVAQYASPRTRFLVRASYLQIYNETISDLLKPERNNLTIREDPRKGVYVEGLSEWVVRTPQEIYGLMRMGGQLRATGSTRLNEVSSRSHAVFIIIVEQSESYYVDEQGNEITLDDLGHLLSSKELTRAEADVLVEQHVRQSFRVGKLNLVDLAGSERVRVSGAKGLRLEETKKINQSLSALGNVISALTDSRERQHIPYRDSKLTRILEDSLGGNCKTTMMAMVSPALESMAETLSTVKFAHRAKNIKNDPVINEDLDQKSLLRKYERELKRLRAELSERNRNVVDKRQLLQLEEQRKRAEADKMAAIRALEARSVEFMLEKEEKRQLEQRIQQLTSQVMGAAQGGNDALSEQMRLEYEGKLADLERERESIEEKKAQVDRYKQLLLKQRDIMIALTHRLNERDEQLASLHGELENRGQQQRDLEEQLDAKTAQLIHLEKAILEHNAARAEDNADLVEAMEWGDGSRQTLQSGSMESHGPFELPENADMSPPPSRIRSGVTRRLEDEASELAAMLEASQAEMKRMSHEIDALRGEKASIETLLREKLERLVQAEIEMRLKNGAGPDGVEDHGFGIASTKDTPASDSTSESLRSELAQARHQIAAKESEVTRLGQRCQALASERQAIRTIMVQVLVDNVANSTEAALARSVPSSPLHLVRTDLQNDIGALQKLVKASLTALKNAELADAVR